MSTLDKVARYLEEHPSPPPLGRGVQKHMIGFNTSIEEWEMLTRIADHPAGRTHFRGTVQDVLRWMIYYSAEQLEGLLDHGEVKGIIKRLYDEIRRCDLEIGVKEIDNFLDIKGYEIRLLLESGLDEDALDVYAGLLKFVVRQKAPWGQVLSKKLFEHKEIDKLREHFAKRHPERLREMEDRLHV